LLQHLNCAGPGQSPLVLVPEQSLIQLQRDVASPPLHGSRKQHLTFAGSAGHAPATVCPPSAEQAAAPTQTPGVPSPA